MTLLTLSALWLYLMTSMILPMHPLSLGMMVLVLAFINCVLVSTMSPWYAYMLFFIFIGGMLVMFAYIASLSPNMTFFINPQLLPITLTITTIVCFTDLGFTSDHQTNSDLSLSLNSTAQALSSLYSQSGNSCVILLACVLLFTMIASVKLCKPKMGALRPYF
uniref:NADH dehydrogenase subunit 6 n=2 Tax=Lamprotula TaxID=165451 RepID=A0A173CUA0_9BIVA|nr:NADH dehydrogenase subunit 6 [Lamprotula caveata]YP_010180198.1 NADH dehydrogenase subunit 6 [Lamprotula cornuumlunae]ANG44854.1 NADH dehydrogenase subunit 6 [Lamprotula caveata]QUX33427.1 NADH dehydrogenase subunit 6 [Lamprotula cornuumlunae]